MADEDDLVGAMKAAWEAAVAIVPARGGVVLADLERLEAGLAAVAAVQPAGLAAIPDEDARRELEGTIAAIYARCAACAIAAGDSTRSDRWLAAAQEHSQDDDQKAELAAARANQERYRMLVHGRNLIAHNREAEARKLWKQLVDGGDAIARAAADEHKAPRPLGDREMPTLERWNGIGLGFYGRRDRWSDGSYATTHCFSVLFIPVIPLKAYRVRDADGGYIVMAREQLSKFARMARLAVPLAIVAVVAGLILNSYLNDPARLARQRWDRALDTAGLDPEAALKQIDDELAGPDLGRVDNVRIERAGAAIVELSASYVPVPLTPDAADQAAKVVRRYEGLTDAARGGAARDAMLAALDGWIGQIGDKVDRADARVELLQHAQRVADPGRAGKYQGLLATTKLQLASAKTQDWPVEALAILIDPATGKIVVGPETEKIIERLVASPSLLVDAGTDLDAWLGAAGDGSLATKAKEQRDAAVAGRTEAEAKDVTPAQLAAMEKKRPWDQFVQLQLAKDELAKGKLDAAAARLDKLGSPGMLVRDARYILGRVASTQGKLDKARLLLSSLLGPRLQRFTVASTALDEAIKKVRDKISNLRDDQIPPDLLHKLKTAPQDEQRELFDEYVRKLMSDDPDVIRRREALDAFADVVPAAIATGAVELRLAHSLTGAAREAMLKDAERTFLAIRAEAQGQPEYRLGLAEIYARLGKAKESEAEFAAALAQSDPKLTYEVANTYRDLGNIERAKHVATELYEKGPSDQDGVRIKQLAAQLMGLMTREEEAETWFRRGDPESTFVKISLLELEARKLQRRGKGSECAGKFVAIAKAWLATANAAQTSGYNNGAVAYEEAFGCSGEVSMLAEADAALAKAYKVHPDDAIVTANYGQLLQHASYIRQLGKRVDVRALRPGSSETERLISLVLESSERDKLLADLAADPAQAKSADLLAQYEVLAPNSPGVYQSQLQQADDRRDSTAAAAVVERARRAKLDTSEHVASRERWRSGSEDARLFEESAATIARLDEVLARPGLDAKTRAAARYLQLYARSIFAVYRRDAAALAKMREDALAAMAGWSVIDANSWITSTLIDEAGLAAGADAWVDLRRSRSAISSLAKAPQPLVDKVQASPQWREVATYARADHSRPSIDDVRLARLLGDAELEKRASAVFDDKLARATAELRVVMSPKDDVAAEDLAFIAKH